MRRFGPAVFLLCLAAACAPSRPTEPPGPIPRYAEVDLGRFERELLLESGAVLFRIQVVLVLDSDVQDLASLESYVQSRKNLLRDTVVEILVAKNPSSFAMPGAPVDLKKALRVRMNKLLAGSFGDTPVERVLFPEWTAPSK